MTGRVETSVAHLQDREANVVSDKQRPCLSDSAKESSWKVNRLHESRLKPLEDSVSTFLDSSFTVDGSSGSETIEDEIASAKQTDCYLSLPSFCDFRQICDSRHYRTVPGDWSVIVTDVAGSTQLVEAGRYRDVNTVGAMPIAAVRNAIGDNFPFVFGGDGASLVVRPQQKNTAITTLLAVQRLVQSNYDMHLRVGCVDVSRLEQLGTTVKVARYEIAPGTSIAMFAGKGLSMAEGIIKGGEVLEETPESQLVVPNLAGLSCRWDKVPNHNGQVVTLLVSACPGKSNDQEQHIYDEVIAKLANIIPFDDSNPVNMGSAQYKRADKVIHEEKRMHEKRQKLSWAQRAAEIRLCHIFFYWRKLQKSIIDVPAYMRSMRAHADHRKFDDTIRMVVDCSDHQAQHVQSTLQQLYREGKICFGMHRSEHSLLTCLVEDIPKGKHVHFVDGDAGGYTLAAKQLKKQLDAQLSTRVQL